MLLTGIVRRASPTFILNFILILLSGCVEQFYPDGSDLKTGVVVINAHLTDELDLQHVEILLSTDLSTPKYDPVNGCSVILEREDGEIRYFLASAPGKYSYEMDRDFVVTGSSYRLQVYTSDGKEYLSEFDRLRPAPEIDSIYYQVERQSYLSATNVEEGIRFYIDFTYDNEEFEYIRWELTETYEFHNPVFEEVWIWESRWRYYTLPDSLRPTVCYLTHHLQDLHSMSLQDLVNGVYIKKPFSFVPNIRNEQKLHHKYALLVRQYSIGPEAFHYWNELKKTSQEQGFLFDSQPALLASNICNVNDPMERVLGFFSMAGVKQARGIATDLKELDRSPNKYYCMPVDRGPGSSDPAYYPVYYATATYDGQTYTEIVNDHCVDCRFYEGSTNIKPDYW